MDATTWDRTDRLYEMWPVLTASRKREAVSTRKRKFRLIACALCRCIWHLLDDERSRRAVEAAEQFADGHIAEAALARAQREAWAAHCRGDEPRRQAALRTGHRPIDFGLADHAGGWVAHKDPLKAAEKAAGNVGWVRYSAADKASIWRTSDLIREAFGNPFRPAAFDAAWRTAEVSALAQAAYDERSLPSGRLDTERLGVLADALEEAGCDNRALLGHLRSDGPHVRGCWALDLVLCKG